MEYTIKIRTNNAAFEDGAGFELARILRELAGDLSRYGNPVVRELVDYNGNIVGKATYGDTEGHNGYTNFDTWAVAAALSNDGDSPYPHACEHLDELRESAEMLQADGLIHEDVDLDDVNWLEVYGTLNDF